MQFLSLRVNKLNHKREGKFSLILFRLILVDLDLPYNYFQLVTIFSIYLKYSSVPAILANKRYLAYAIENYLAGLFYLYSVRTAAWARDFDWVHNKKKIIKLWRMCQVSVQGHVPYHECEYRANSQYHELQII
jgi:hypothetical protein